MVKTAEYVSRAIIALLPIPALQFPSSATPTIQTQERAQAAKAAISSKTVNVFTLPWVLMPTVSATTPQLTVILANQDTIC